ncbi:MAG: alpha/beta hydrolase [Patescibacteria group bacterium]
MGIEHQHLPDRKILDISSEQLGYNLEAVIFEPAQPTALVVTTFGIPRGQDNDKSYVPDRFAPFIAEQGMVATAHSPAGLGNSGGDTTELSLDGRANEVVEVAMAAHAKHPDLPVTLYGSSMGAHIIIRAAQKLTKRNVKVDNLVVVSSAAYPDRSETATFGEAFRQAITGSHDLPISGFSVFEALEAFDGKVMFAWVEHDSTENGGPIYPQMIDWYNQTYEARKALGRADTFVNVHGAEHSFRVDGKGIDESPEALVVFRNFCQKVKEFVFTRV